MNPPAELALLSLSDAAELVRIKAVSPVELTESCLARIAELDSKLNSFITVSADAAMQQARAAEAEIVHGDWRGPLHGMPLALKDLIDTAGVKTTAASALYQNRVPTADAAVVTRLKSAGAVLLGKLNLHEFAYGGSGLISHYGPVHNPWALHRVTGGSSSGSAAAVAAGLCYGALGTDTAGSIRLPAALCGIVGHKPTYGVVSTRGVIPLAGSYDHVGPMARTVRDTAALLRELAPEFDNLQVAAEVPRPLRVGVARQFFCEELDPEIAAAFECALKVLAGFKAEFRDVVVPVDSDRTVQPCEAYVYHAGFSAVAPLLYQPETLRRIKSGAGISPELYTEKRQRVQQMRGQVPALFAELEVIVSPTSPVPAPTIAELQAHPSELRKRELVMLRNTRPFNVLGVPAISVPCGFTSQGLPIGLQIAGPPGADATVLQLAHAYEQATEWHQRPLPATLGSPAAL